PRQHTEDEPVTPIPAPTPPRLAGASAEALHSSSAFPGCARSAERDDPTWADPPYHVSTSLLPDHADAGRLEGGHMPRSLPDRPSLELLKKQAKALLARAREGEA